MSASLNKSIAFAYWDNYYSAISETINIIDLSGIFQVFGKKPADGIIGHELRKTGNCPRLNQR
ncbi:hypothetical protein SAMN05216326_11484 [Nitrosomonas marina]|uniref:Uncharacterized protein n=1 Tax=Nitrosomonas marina TaxID=917 RepID=A0A1I0CGT0_9PROT|nr:hypothetical protein [Nitrosomonas marina]SET18360.1 hypothetical protein SAMN05216326_11484 [Nitrosomonas marina]